MRPCGRETLALLVSLAGCHTLRQADPGELVVTQASVSDSVRGRVSVVGSEPMVGVLLSPTGGGATLALSGAPSVLLRGLGGLDVVVRGRLTGERSGTATPRMAPEFSVDEFEVRAADGVSATDGVVAVADGSFFLVTADGRRLAARYLPQALRQKVGARVFVAGALDGEAASYGVIRERP